MPPVTRLDPLLKLKEREEQQRLLELAAASRTLQAAQRRVDDLVRTLAGEEVTSGPVESWLLREEAHQRALRDLLQARAAVAAAELAFEAARTACLAAKRTVETFRKVTDRKRAEILREIERREQKNSRGDGGFAGSQVTPLAGREQLT